MTKTTDCSDCIADNRALDRWRAEGGKMPRKNCNIDHRPKCKTDDCDNRHESRASGYCDKCYTEYRKRRKPNKQRLNPLDALTQTDGFVIR